MPSQKIQRAYGSWPSALDAAALAKAGVRHGQIRADGADFYWSESRPQEKGRMVIVRRAGKGTAEDVLPPPYNARSQVHEYGGGEFAVCAGQLAFVNDTDQDLYLVQRNGTVDRLTAAPDT
ncbi:MAG: S9 family peptidase, partial [Alphaproteobacteria bacterium]